MNNSQLAYQFQVLFKTKITDYYYSTYKGFFGKVQIEVLDYLYENKQAITQEIALALNTSKQHTSKILLRLMEMELVIRSPESLNKRETLYHLTNKGKELVDSHIQMSNQHFEALLAKLNINEQEKLSNCMNEIIQILEKI